MHQGPDLQDALNHFRRTPWCAELLDAPGVVCKVPVSRRARGHPGEPLLSQDQLVRTALNTPDALPYMLLFHKDPEVEVANAAETAQSPPASPSGPAFFIRSVSLLLDLQRHLAGFSGAIHGGFLATAMDEVMGSLLVANYTHQREQERKHQNTQQQQQQRRRWRPPAHIMDMQDGVRIMTASMHIRFQRPLMLPRTVVTTATLSRIEGRKIYLDVTVHDHEEVVYARGEGMWMILLPKQGSL
ncbi:thioesterase superfamily protein [Niveomyces insectorum RCEF 264]|uniref:Acyl-coenzyme A thioesterase THEM4 n=1 Tax=Niveomyces insectorum RCEF 264 TaxID=1081102 RepID=A0A167YLF3_9HYPO|nr:thioesterase superfamily protein [Niveomyces insectorum RCEF 264]